MSEDVQSVRRFIAERTANPEHRQDVLDGDYDGTDWFAHVRAALSASSAKVRRMQTRNTDMGVELRKRAEAINRLTDELERIKADTDLKRFRKLASWVANCAGHGINDSQRRMGEELLALIDSHKRQT